MVVGCIFENIYNTLTWLEKTLLEELDLILRINTHQNCAVMGKSSNDDHKHIWAMEYLRLEKWCKEEPPIRD